MKIVSEVPPPAHAEAARALFEARMAPQLQVFERRHGTQQPGARVCEGRSLNDLYELMRAQGAIVAPEQRPDRASGSGEQPRARVAPEVPAPAASTAGVFKLIDRYGLPLAC